MGAFHERLGERLSLYVRQLAWLYAAPVADAAVSKGKQKPKQPAESRLKIMKRRGITPALPVNPLPQVTEWLLEIGPTVPGGMGEAAIGWQDLAAWQQISGVELEPWEAKLIRRLSKDYLAESVRAREANAPAPYSGGKASVAANRDAVAAQIAAAFGGRAQKK